MSDIESEIIELNAKSEAEAEVKSEADASSLSSVSSTIPFYETLNEQETSDFISTIYSILEDYMKTEIAKIAKPDFHKEAIDDITHILFQSLQDAEICDDEDYQPIYDYVEWHCAAWFENKEDMNYPLRSIAFYKDNYHCEEYGLVSEFVESYLTNKIIHLRRVNEESPKQRTPEWYQRRYNMMTASNLWQALSTDAQRNRLIFDKCKPLDFGYTENKWINTDNSLHWGVKYEPLTAMIYEKMTGAKLEEFGCITHPAHPFIGASPDGIVANIESPLFGRMVEIKNIYNREMDGIPSEAYWIQMQIQMECCNLDICDFVETRFKEYPSMIAFLEEHDDSIERGVILHFVPKDSTTNVPIYKYLILDIILYDTMVMDDRITAYNKTIDEWTEQCKAEMPEYAVYNKIYWYLQEICMSTVLRNNAWFCEVLPKIRDTWATIEVERVSGYQHRAAKKRVVNTNDVIVIKSSSDGPESHLIRNMPSNGKGVCLIKMDSASF
jgi:putative phage-type endonuclease